MNILAIDTCFDACSAAAGRALRSLTPSIATAFEPMVVGHAERLMPMIDEVLREAGLRPMDLDRIAVATGPGTFAGTRICVSAARALALATGADIVTRSSLNLMAMNPAIPAAPGRSLVMATDARRDEVYLQRIDRHTLLPASDPQVVPLAGLADWLDAGSVVFAGNGAERAAAAARDAGLAADAVCGDLLPDAFDMLFAAFDFPVTPAPVPLYLRPPDAKPPPPNVLLGRHI